ncbi:hypothetical protein [uncultured Psychrobacter sp.]|uniref:hypothetical protein n=1 Tax=uncultured Psychrobacter sp. TaxID=259303 RepID=UPI002620CFBC|nr:hypothetical protein [uncultured Psychrobacter sp.]
MIKTLKKFEHIFKTSWLSSVLSIFLFLYYTTLDIWGDEWDWIALNKESHGNFYKFLIVATVISVLFKAYYDYTSDKNKKENELVLQRFIGLIRSIVTTKKNRFYEKATRLKTESRRVNFFQEITHPQDQIKFIMNQLSGFFEFWGVNRNQLAVTILSSVAKDESDNENWRFVLKLDHQRSHTSANTLMKGDSLARKAIDSGVPIFLADLNEGIFQQVFLQSERSQESNNIGSIYCKPVTIKIQDVTYRYVFSVVSYGTYLCQPTDTIEAEQMSMILNEIGDRVELELYLSAMKQHKSKS